MSISMKRFTTTIFFSVSVAILLAVMPVHAEFDFGAKYAGDFISGQSDARLLAMGGVGVAISQGPSAIMANPALLFNKSANAISLMHADRFESAVKVDHASFVMNRGGGRALGIGLVRQGVDDIPITILEDPSRPVSQDNRVRVIDQASASEYAFQFAYAMQKSYGFIGANAKLIYKRLYESDAFGLGVDVGYAREFGNLVVGAQLRDALTTVLVWDNGRQEAIVPTVRVGTAYKLEIPRLKADITPVIEGRFRTESIDDPDFGSFHAGLEYCVQKVVAARVGVDDRRFTYGAGLNVGPVALNYAFVGHSDLGATHRVSVGYRWGVLAAPN